MANVKVYMEQGGARQVIASGGSLDVESGGEIDIESGGALKFDGVAVDTLVAEINRIGGIFNTVTFNASAASTDQCLVSVTVKDSAGAAIAAVQTLRMHVSDAATGLGIAGTGADGAVTAVTGAEVVAHVAKKVFDVQTDAAGELVYSFVDSGKTTNYIAITDPLTGQMIVSDILATGDYG